MSSVEAEIALKRLFYCFVKLKQDFNHFSCPEVEYETWSNKQFLFYEIPFMIFYDIYEISFMTACSLGFPSGYWICG